MQKVWRGAGNLSLHQQYLSLQPNIKNASVYVRGGGFYTDFDLNIESPATLYLNRGKNERQKLVDSVG